MDKPELKPQTTKRCHICESEALADYYVKEHNLFLKNCLNCSLVFQVTPYKAYFCQNSNDYGFWFKGLSFEDIWQMKLETCLKLLKLLEKVDPQHKKGNLLDIGCAYGFMLEAGKRLGYNEVWGVELSPAAFYAQGKNFQVIKGNFETVELPRNYFDLITLIDVIEHLTSPKTTVLKIKNLLKEQGLVLVLTPDVSSSSAKFLKGLWPHYKPEHIYYYSPKSLKYLFEAHGFVTLKIQPGFKYLSLRYIFNHFLKFSPKWISYFVRPFLRIIPSELSKKPIYWRTELIFIARKGERRNRNLCAP